MGLRVTQASSAPSMEFTAQGPTLRGAVCPQTQQPGCFHTCRPIKSEGKPHRMKTGKDTGMPGRGCGEAESESGRLSAHFPACGSTVRTGPHLSATPSSPARHSSSSHRAPLDRLLSHLLPSRRSGTRERKPGHTCKSKPDRPRTPAFQYLVLVGRQKMTHIENRLYPHRVNPGRVSRPRAVLELQDRGHPGSLPGGGSA